MADAWEDTTGCIQADCVHGVFYSASPPLSGDLVIYTSAAAGVGISAQAMVRCMGDSLFVCACSQAVGICSQIIHREVGILIIGVWMNESDHVSDDCGMCIYSTRMTI